MSSQVPEEGHWPELQRERRAIVVVDVVESVRLMQEHENDVIDRWRRFVHDVRQDILPPNGGQMVKSLGDGMLVVFQSVGSAVVAVLAMVARVEHYNQGRPASALLVLRVGLHAGDVVFDEVDVFGPAVNLAARLAGLAADGGIVVSAEARDEILPGFDAQIEDLGERDLRGFSQPVRAFRLGPAPQAPLQHWGDTLRARPSLMVVPFGLVGDGLQPVTGLLVVDNLTRQLSRQPYWNVISGLSSRAAARRPADSLALARAAGAHYVVSGLCAPTGARLLVTFEVASVADANVVHAGRVQGDPQQLLSDDDAITAELLQQVGQAVLSAEVTRAASRPMPTLQSYAMLFGGQALMHRMSRVDFARAHELLAFLCERHPRAPEPRAWMGKWHVLNIVQGWSQDVDLSANLGQDQVRRALEHDPDHALALTVDGLIEVLLRDDLGSAESRYQSALSANPNEAYAHLFQSALLAYTERGADAVSSARTAIALSPLDPNRYFFDSFLAHACLCNGQLQDAIDAAQASVRLNAAHVPTWRTLVIAAQMAGQDGLARQAVQRLFALQPDFTVDKFLRRYPGRDSRGVATQAQALVAAGVPQGAA